MEDKMAAQDNAEDKMATPDNAEDKMDSSDNASSKRKHKTLTLREKMDILKRLEKRESPSLLAKEYGVGRATLHDIKKKKLKLTELFETMEGVEGKRKTLKGGDYPEMENALFKWFLKERAKKKTISGDALKVKAREFYQKIMKKDDFQASAGWLDKFKKRYGIRLQSKTFPKSIYAVQNLLIDKIEKLGLTPDQVYNAKEGTILWRMLPTQISKTPENCPKTNRERITFMPCANASGTHKIDITVVGQSEDSEAFKTVPLPVNYKNNFNAYITKNMLMQWFKEKFIPEVKEFMKTSNIPEKALLILYDGSGDLKAKELKSSDGNIETLILPPNSSHFLQPMSHIIQTVRSKSKKQLIIDVIAQGGDISQRLDEMNTMNVLSALADSWNSISARKITSSWEKLWPSMTEHMLKTGKDEEKEKPEEVLPLSTWLKIVGDKNLKISQRQLTTWFEANDDDEEQQEEDICTEDLLEVVLQEDSPQCEPSVSSEEAVQCFNKCITWAEQNGLSAAEVTVLKNLRKFAMQGQETNKSVTD